MSDQDQASPQGATRENQKADGLLGCTAPGIQDGPPSTSWRQCQICALQRNHGTAHWAWHQYCRGEVNPLALVQWLQSGWREDWREPMNRVAAYVVAVTGMDVDAAMDALKREQRQSLGEASGSGDSKA